MNILKTGRKRDPPMKPGPLDIWIKADIRISLRVPFSSPRFSPVLVPHQRRLRPDGRRYRARLPPLSQHGQHMVLLQLQGPRLSRGQLCPNLHLVNTSPPSSDSSYWVSHVYIFADQYIVRQVLLFFFYCPFGGRYCDPFTERLLKSLSLRSE